MDTYINSLFFKIFKKHNQITQFWELLKSREPKLFINIQMLYNQMRLK